MLFNITFEMCSLLGTSDWIQIITGVVTLITAVISIIIAVKTLRQNSKMIENSTRPYIVFYKDTIDINNPIEYLVIENFGASAGTITKLEYNQDTLKELFNERAIDMDLLKYFSNITLAPHQRYLFPINSTKVKNKIFNVEIEYKFENKKYNEKFNINLSQDYSVTFNKQHKSLNKPEQEIFTISNTLQELVKRI